MRSDGIEDKLWRRASMIPDGSDPDHEHACGGKSGSQFGCV